MFIVCNVMKIMRKKENPNTDGAYNFARNLFGELISDVNFIGTFDGLECFEPVFIDSPEYGVGFPFFIVLKNGKYRTTTEEEYNTLLGFVED